MRGRAFNAVAGDNASSLHLLWVVANERCKEEMGVMNDSISICHFGAFKVHFTERCKDLGQAGVIYIEQTTPASSLIGYMKETGSGKICQKHISSVGRSSPYFFWNIANCHVNRIRLFATE